MKKPLVSVCIPLYNGAHCISNTIQNVLNQSLQDFELIIVNDNSKDNSEEVVLSFSDERIKYYKNPTNLGMVNNWNKAVSLAKGKYIKLLCMDDLLEYDCLELQAHALENNENISVVTCNTNIIDSDNNILLIRKNFHKEGIYNGREVAKKSLVTGQNIFGEPSVVMYKGTSLHITGAYDKAFWYVPDWDCTIRVLQGGDLYFIDKVLASFRISPTSQTSTIIKNNKLAIIKEDKLFMDKHTQMLLISPLQKLYHYGRTTGRLILKNIYLKYISWKGDKKHVLHPREATP